MIAGCTRTSGAQRYEGVAKVERGDHLETHSLAGARMGKTKDTRVQRLMSEAQRHRANPLVTGKRAIQRVSKDGGS